MSEQLPTHREVEVERVPKALADEMADAAEALLSAIDRQSLEVPAEMYFRLRAARAEYKQATS